MNEAAEALFFYWLLGSAFLCMCRRACSGAMGANVLETTGEHGCKFGCVGGKL